MVGDMELIVKAELQPETDRLTKLIQTMDESEQSKMNIFVQGMKFAQTLEQTRREA